MANASNRFTVKFRGVRGSHAMPGPSTVRFGGNTSCIEVHTGNQLIILDAGTGIIGLGNEIISNHVASGNNVNNRTPITFTILFSHTHHDHTQGFAFFKPAYIPTSTCYLFGPRLLGEDLEQGLSKAMVSPYFPVELEDLPSLRKVKSVLESEMIVFENDNDPPQVLNFYRDDQARSNHKIRIRALHSRAHPNGGVFVYRIEMNGKSVVYATDTEGYMGGDQRLVNFSRGCSLLIHDSQYMHADYVGGANYVQGYGHSTVDMAADVASQAGVNQLALFHYDPMYDDATLGEMEKRAQSIFKNSIASFEGLEITL